MRSTTGIRQILIGGRANQAINRAIQLANTPDDDTADAVAPRHVAERDPSIKCGWADAAKRGGFFTPEKPDRVIRTYHS